MSPMNQPATILMVTGMVVFMAFVMVAIHLMRANHQRLHGATAAHSGHSVFPIFNSMVKMLLRLGIPVTILGPMMLLTVRGRKTGKPHTIPIDVHDHQGTRYLIATHGVGNWVYNLRAAGEGILSIGWRHQPFTATELSAESGGVIIRDTLGPLLASQGIRGSMLRQNFGVAADATLAEFITVAQSHPVFVLAIPVK